MLVSFKCDVCIFQQLWDREPNSELEVDKLAMMCIRRVNLHAFLLANRKIAMRKNWLSSHRRKEDNNRYAWHCKSN